MKKNVIYWLIHIDFQIQEIFSSRLASPINKLVCLSDLQFFREIFPVSQSQYELISILAHLSRMLGRPLSSACVCMSTFSNIFSSETTEPVKVKFHMEHPPDRWTKVCSTGSGHMTKVAAMPIYDKNLKNSSSPEPKGRWLWNLVCSIGC